jgi:hypothetical protein
MSRLSIDHESPVSISSRPESIAALVLAAVVENGLYEPTQASIVLDNVVLAQLMQIDGASIATKKDGLKSFINSASAYVVDKT